jgi:hypothetical protein
VSTSYTVQAGDCLSSIAHQHGFNDPLTVWNHADNATLRKQRPDMNVLRPGDLLHIPDKERGDLPAATDATHRFRVKRQRVMLDVVLLVDGEPLAGMPCEITLASGMVTVSTDGAGHLRQPIAADEARALIRIPELDIEWQLPLGHLDPVDEVHGVQQRLRNLGHPCGELDGQAGPRVRAALRQFQARQGLTPSGAIDGPTKARLTGRHDRPA